MPETIPTFTATRWTPLEVSLVNIGADPAARIRSQEGAMPETNQDTTAPGAETRANPDPAALLPAGGAVADQVRQAQDDVRRVYQACRLARVDNTIGDQLLERMSADAACRELLDRAAQRDAANEILIRAGGHDGEDDPEFRARQCVDALAHRLSGGTIALPETAQPVRGMNLNEMIAYTDAGERHQRSGWLGQRSGFGAGHTTSDFPQLLLGSAGERVLAETFMIMATPLRQVARTIQVPDFKDITRARRGEAAKLLEIAEHGEIQSSSVGEEHETYRVKSYARNFILTRNAIINDDLNAFGDFLADMGRAAAWTEADLLVGLITGDGVTLTDGTTLWHANHGNLGTGGAISVTTVGEARQLLRLQASPTNDEPLNLPVRYLLVPAALETAAEQLVAKVTAATIDNVNVFTGRLQVLVEPRLDAASVTTWYVITDPANLPFLEIATLDGSRRMATAGAPQLDVFEGERVLGMQMRAVHDVGSWPVNYRAAVKNAGA